LGAADGGVKSDGKIIHGIFSKSSPRKNAKCETRDVALQPSHRREPVIRAATIIKNRLTPEKGTCNFFYLED
jgi:hypothetical protein